MAGARLEGRWLTRRGAGRQEIAELLLDYTRDVNHAVGLAAMKNG